MSSDIRPIVVTEAEPAMADVVASHVPRQARWWKSPPIANRSLASRR
jgi:hypothetical protein